LFEKANILHRDISAGNLMVDASNPAQGVLIDLDFAAEIAEHGEPANGESFPQAGTLHFRAFDLITPEKPLKAYYRHDLESFFYALLWIQTHYEDGKKILSREDNHFDFNFEGSWRTTQGYKKGFLLAFNVPRDSLPLTSLRDYWIVPLRRLFGEALMANTDAFLSHRRGESALLDQETLGGRVTYETFNNILQT
jgi:serine/threonine protein kinase